jgi:hypothetical protein
LKGDLAEIQVEESREAYMSQDVLGAWQEPPAPPSSSFSRFMGSSSSSPSIDKGIKVGKSRIAAAPVELAIGSYHAHHQSQCTENEEEDDATRSGGTIDRPITEQD